MKRAKKILNDPRNAADELLAGLVAAYRGEVTRLEGTGAVVKRQLAEGKVALLIGGGSGHEPLFPALIGHNLADGAACGHVFAAPSPDVILAATKALDRRRGVLYLYGNAHGAHLG